MIRAGPDLAERLRPSGCGVVGSAGLEATPGLYHPGGRGTGYGQNVNDNTESASNSSTGGYESHYYLNINYDTFLFCVNPGSYVEYLPSGQANLASSLQLTGTTSISCY